MARHYSELVVWKLADEIRQLVFQWTRRPPFSTDFRGKAQIEDAAESVCRNIAEGFSASHAQFANYLSISRRSLNEVTDCTRSARLKQYIEADDAQALNVLCRRLYPALARLIKYLRETPDPASHPGRDGKR